MTQIGIVGGNSQVGTEVAFYLREMGHRVVPIVRNELATSFLKKHNFNCLVGDIKNPSEAEELLSNLDVVVVAAFAPFASRTVPQPKKASKINESIVRNSVRHSEEDATIVYLSSVSVFGKDLYNSLIGVLDDWKFYVRQKRKGETINEKECEKLQKRWYNLRLGHVFGSNQQLTQSLKSSLSEQEYARVPVEPDRKSNVVHVVTIAEAIDLCGTNRLNPGTYTLVNRPQWSWDDVLSTYAPPGTDIKFVGGTSQEKSLVSFIARNLATIKSKADVISIVLTFLPEKVNDYLGTKYRYSQVRSEIADYEDRFSLELPQFDQSEVHGSQIDGLTETSKLLDRNEQVVQAFKYD